MRLKRNRLAICHLVKMIPSKDKEGNSFLEYKDMADFYAEEWPAGGKLQSERYGLRLPNIRNLRIEGRYSETMCADGSLGYELSNGAVLAVNDGITFAPGGCLFAGMHLHPDECLTPATSKPDYRIIAIYPYRFLTLEVERI